MNNHSFYDSDIVAFGYFGHGVTAGEELLQTRLRRESGPLLDVGCGSGRMHTRLSSVCGALIGVDYAHAQLRVYKAYFPDAQLVQGTATDLPFADEAFGTVLMGYHMIESILPASARADALRSAARVLKSGGTLFLTRHVRRNYHLLDQVRNFALQRVAKFGDLLGPARTMGGLSHRATFRMHALSRQELLRQTRGAGLRHTESWDFDTGGPVRWASRAVVERYVRG